MKHIILAIFVLVSLYGCSEDKKNTTVNKSDIATVTRKLIFKIQNNTEKLQNQINRLQHSVDEITNEKGRDSVAVFTPSSKGYSILKTNIGNLAVSLENLTKYANGYRATFSIGNPNMVTINNLTIHINWGVSYEKSSEITVTKPILPGVWNKVIVVLSPATAKEIGRIGLYLMANNLSFTTDYRKTTG